MTKRDDRVSLVDMLVYSEEAIELLGETSAVELADDRTLRLALERLVGIVGEAARRVSPATQQRHPEIPWAEIIGMRNRVVHGYDAINLSRMWDTVKYEMPPHWLNNWLRSSAETPADPFPATGHRGTTSQASPQHV